MRVLNEKEEQVMQILWRLKKAFVKEILEELPKPSPPYNTISSIVRKLESEGMIDHQSFGKTNQYFPVLKKMQYRKMRFNRMIRDYFSDSPEQLLSYFVKEEQVDPEELSNILKQIKTQDR